MLIFAINKCEIIKILIMETTLTRYSDANGMMKGVLDSITNVLKEHGHMTADEAKEYISQMTKDSRYLMDVWL